MEDATLDAAPACACSRESSASRCAARSAGVIVRVAAKNRANHESSAMEYSCWVLATAWSTPMVPHALPIVCRVNHTPGETASEAALLFAD